MFTVHETGHALLLFLERPGTLLSVSIRETAETHGGIMAAFDDGLPMTREDVMAHLRIFLAGRAAEEVVLGDVSAGAGGGAGSDLAKATMLAARSLHAEVVPVPRTVLRLG